MSAPVALSCRCGAVQIEVEGAPICVTECLCTSCRQAAARLGALEGAPDLLTGYGATACGEYRKDRVTLLAGQEHLRAFRLSPDAGTRRAVADCCNTPVFIEAKGGHWLSLYAGLWPEGEMPPVQMRTMVGDLDDKGASLPGDVPNHAKFAPRFMWGLLVALFAMGFRNPEVKLEGAIDA